MHISKRLSQGFSLVEILIVISVISILCLMGVYSYNELTLRFAAVKTLADFKDITEGWKTWTLTEERNFRLDSAYYNNIDGRNSPGYTPPSGGECSNANGNPPLSKTELLDPVLLGDNHPFLKEIPRHPRTGNEYHYDNDQEPSNEAWPPTPGSTGFSEVNIFVYLCNNQMSVARANRLAEIVDEIGDGSNGPSTGKVRWAPYLDAIVIAYKMAENVTCTGASPPSCTVEF